MYAGHLLFGPSLNLPGVECSMEVDTAELLPSGPSVDSPDAKRQMGRKVSQFVRHTNKAMRKGVRIEARRQRELEEGRPPEVLLESFLELLKHKVRRVPVATETCPDFSCQGCKAPSCKGQEKA